MLTKKLIEEAIRVIKSKIAHSSDTDRDAWMEEKAGLEAELSPMIGAAS